MREVKKILRRLLSPSVRQWINNRWLLRRARLLWKNELILKPALKRQLSAGASLPVRNAKARVLVPLLQSTHYQYYQILALAKALQLRGAEIKVVLCDSVLDGCELKNGRRTETDQCLTCRTNARDLVPLFGLETVTLTELIAPDHKRLLRARAAEVAAHYPERFEYKGIELSGMVNDSVTRFYYGDVPPNGSPALEHQRQRSLYSAMVGVEAAQKLVAQWRPTTAINDMNVYTDWAPYAKVFKQNKIPYNLISIAPFDFTSVMLNYEDYYTGTARFDRWRAQRPQPTLDAAEQQTLDAWLAERFSVGGGFEQKWDWFAGEAAPIIQKIDTAKRNIFLFANLFWDVGINYEGSLYENVFAWVLDTIRITADQPGTHLYVKPHPEEAYGSAPSGRGVADVIREHFGKVPEHVTIIPPELKIKSYDLFPYMALGIVYNSTLGLEMILKGIPVVTVGKAPYGGSGMCLEPRTVSEYAQALRGEIAPPRPDPKLVQLFSYFYFFKSHIPWHLTRQVYADDFRGFTFDRLDDLLPGRDPHLDHLCRSILEPQATVPEAWA